MSNNQMETLTKWEQLKIKSKVVNQVDLEFANGEVFPIEIQSVSQATLDAITDKYDDQKVGRPKTFNRDLKKWVEATEDSNEYVQWEKKNRIIESLKMAELALAFMVEKPPGKTTEDQIKELKETIRPGDFIKIVQAGYEACGFNFDEGKVRDAKNS